MLPDGHLREALTFDDVLLVPADSDVVPKDVDVRTRLTAAIRAGHPARHRRRWTRSPRPRTAIAMAREGGIGILHKNLTIDEQAREVTKVKKAESGMVVDPVTVGPDADAGGGARADAPHDICGLPVVAADGRPVGILTNRDVRFERNLDQPVSAMMTKKLVTVARGQSARERQGAAAQAPHREAARRRRRGLLKGLITIKDIEKAQQHPTRPRTTAAACASARAVGVGPDRDERVEALLDAGCDVIVHRHRARPLARRVDAVARRPAELPQGAAHRRQRRHRRGDAWR